ncbi:MAG: helix-turn-helix transcriptional regulator [Clostridiales bacterium]|nr:helix-turn-helix transcriptional regulator [Clostridiales bacterium]
MLLNNIEIDVKVKCIEQNKPQSKLAEEIGTSAPYVSRVVNSGDKILNKTFVQIMEHLGYDIELTYVKRNES